MNAAIFETFEIHCGATSPSKTSRQILSTLLKASSASRSAGWRFRDPDSSGIRRFFERLQIDNERIEVRCAQLRGLPMRVFDHLDVYEDS